MNNRHVSPKAINHDPTNPQNNRHVSHTTHHTRLNAPRTTRGSHKHLPPHKTRDIYYIPRAHNSLNPPPPHTHAHARLAPKKVLRPTTNPTSCKTQQQHTYKTLHTTRHVLHTLRYCNGRFTVCISPTTNPTSCKTQQQHTHTTEQNDPTRPNNKTQQ